MSKILIIAEKPKLAMNCTGALSLMGESTERKQGYYESDNYIVSYCIGHLFGLKGIDDYTGEKSWSNVKLPYIPSPFEFKLKEEVAEQYQTIEYLVKRTDISKVYHLGDADREGEVIVRMVLQNADNSKPVYRIWTDDQTEAAIKEAIEHIRPDSEYDSLYNEGLARIYMDWLYGINLTRFVTNKSSARPVLRVGRVLIPIVKKIYDRDMAIRDFVAEPYLQAEAKGEKDGIRFALTMKNEKPRITDEEVKRQVQTLNERQTVVVQVEQKEKKVTRPKLFDLGKAQSRIAKLHKISLTDSMGCIQALYESGYLTYPRTDSEYLASTEVEKVQSVIRSIQNANPEISLTLRNESSVFNDKKVIGHSALRPTHKIPSITDFNNLVPEARNKANNRGITVTVIQKVYETIFHRFCAVFAAEDCVVSDTVITVQNGEETFELKGKETIRQGFMAYDNTENKDKAVPNLKKGEVLNITWKAEQKETVPPKHLTVEALDNYLRNPFKNENEDDYDAIAKGLSIGTQATRTSIIQNAIDSEYISLTDNIYYIEKRGEYLIHTLDAMHIDMYKGKTVELNQRLLAVHQGALSIDECICLCADELKKTIEQAELVKDTELCGYNETSEKTWVCPFCNGKIRKGKYGYFCQDNKDFSLSKFRGVPVTDAMMDAFIGKKKIYIKGMTGTKGNMDAYILPSGWKHNDKYTNLVHTMEFKKKKK